MWSLHEYFIVLLFVSVPRFCRAVAFPGPTITPAPDWQVDLRPLEQHFAQQNEGPFEPIVTKPPEQQLRMRRRAASTDSFWAAPDNTCGFIDGQPGSGKTCGPEGYTCVAVYDAASMKTGVIGCCGTDGCVAAARCINSADMSVSCTDAACLQNTLTLRCSDSSYPYCYPYIFEEFGNAVYYDCGRTPYTDPVNILLETTYSGETDGRSWTVISSSASVSLSLSATTTTSPTHSPTKTSSPPAKSKAPIGAIVGGAVGGVLGLAGLALLGYYIHRHTRYSRHEHRTSTSEAPQPPSAPPMGVAGLMSPPPPPFSPASGAPGFYGSELGKDETQTHYDTLRSNAMSPASTAPMSLAATSPADTDRRASDLYPVNPYPQADTYPANPYPQADTYPVAQHNPQANAYPVVPQPGGRTYQHDNAFEMP